MPSRKCTWTLHAETGSEDFDIDTHIISVDRAIRCNWIIGLKSLHSDAIINAFHNFRAQAGYLAVQFRTDCNVKLMSDWAVSWIRADGLDFVSAPARRQSSNGLVERQWRTMLERARAYLTDKQIPRAFWLSATQHAAQMTNCIPGKVNNDLTTSF